MFCALSTIEPLIGDRTNVVLFERDNAWSADRLPLVESRIGARLGELSRHLGAHDWLDGAFSVGDLLMITVLRRLNGTELLAKSANIAAYVARGESRPAFKRAFEAQLKVFNDSQT